MPPSILPMLNVVSSLKRPWGNLEMISAAIRIEDSHFSGSTPAWAALPVISISKPMYVGLAYVI